MELERLAVRLRMRNAWEAMDLGFAMVRTWMRPVYGAWLAVFVPLCAFALWALPPQWAVALVWWLKPALDRVVLDVVSKGVFDDLPSIRVTLRGLPQALNPALIASLTWYRFFFARSFDLPVWQLERQRGAKARERRRQLHRRAGGDAAWLTVTCANFEIALGLSLAGLYDLFVPGPAAGAFDLFTLFSGHGEVLAQWGLTLVYFAVVTVIEPAYVAAGFALYLNRRTELEGWDLEVELRRVGSHRPPAQAMAQPPRRETLAPSIIVAIVSSVVLCAQAPPAPAASMGREETSSMPSTHHAASEVGEILKRPELDEFRERTVLRYVGSKSKDAAQPKQDRSRFDFSAIIDLIAQGLRVLAWVALGIAVAVLVRLLLPYLRRFRPDTQPQSYVPPDTLFGLDVRRDSLPVDLAATALRHARDGDFVLALSLLYRGALAALLHHHQVELVTGDTEADCLRKSRPRIEPPAADYLTQLLAAWRASAYAGRPAPLAEVEALCAGWTEHFGAA